MYLSPEDAGVTITAGYDGDASSSSADATLSPGHFDMSTLHDEIETEGECLSESRPEREPFQHHSEETMGGYEEEEATSSSPRRRAPSPESADSWMAYSSNSSESWHGESEQEAHGKRARTSRPVVVAAPPPERVDIRMIDFAHTAYAGAAASSPLATAAPHHGPDGGFLTGVDSLKRLLGEILPPPAYS